MHESLLLDEKDQKLTTFEKHLAQQSYEHDKMKGGRQSARSYSPPRSALSRPGSPPLPPDLSHGPAIVPDRYLSAAFDVFSPV